MQSRDLSGLTVLVIDDHLDSLELVEVALSEAGARVLAAPNAEAGLRFLDTHEVHVLVCGLGMLRGDGFEVVRSVRARKDRKRTLPVLAVSADGAASDAGRAISAGFDAHAQKPVPPATLVAEVRRLAHHVPA